MTTYTNQCNLKINPIPHS